MAAFTALCFLAAILACTGPSEARTLQQMRYSTYVAQLNGRNTVPNPIMSSGTAVFTLNVDSTAQAAYYTFRINNIVNYTMSHIHLANANSNGSPIVFLWPGLASGMKDAKGYVADLPMEDPPVPFLDNMVFRGTVTPNSLASVTAGQAPMTWAQFLKNLQTGNIYVNVHTVKWPAGEIRGQAAYNGNTNKQWAV
eukprot:GHRQ01001456.1.p1 GENE.GHRQ01001456.1~~GHRQ01001456.1.p1  ORF type:complete len:195 (+),score=48.04 GHRQ01001456.1:152-736(+)